MVSIWLTVGAQQMQAETGSQRVLFETEGFRRLQTGMGSLAAQSWHGGARRLHAGTEGARRLLAGMEEVRRLKAGTEE